MIHSTFGCSLGLIAFASWIFFSTSHSYESQTVQRCSGHMLVEGRQTGRNPEMTAPRRTAVSAVIERRPLSKCPENGRPGCIIRVAFVTQA